VAGLEAPKLTAEAEEEEPKENPDPVEEGAGAGATGLLEAAESEELPLLSLDSQATQRSAVLSLKTMQTEHFTEFARLINASGKPLLLPLLLLLPVLLMALLEDFDVASESLFGSLDSQATQRSAVLSLKTMQTGHLIELDLFTRDSGRPLKGKELPELESEDFSFVTGAAVVEASGLRLGPPGVGGNFFETFFAGGEKTKRTCLLAEEAALRLYDDENSSSSSPSMSLGALKVNSAGDSASVALDCENFGV
jgi:hypothetical protein